MVSRKIRNSLSHSVTAIRLPLEGAVEQSETEGVNKGAETANYSLYAEIKFIDSQKGLYFYSPFCILRYYFSASASRFVIVTLTVLYALLITEALRLGS